jgi:hypothetical protein
MACIFHVPAGNLSVWRYVVLYPPGLLQAPLPSFATASLLTIGEASGLTLKGTTHLTHIVALAAGTTRFVAVPA